ncbi:MAG: hypothetical protein CSA38_01355 [Flavobacteriales bacterium]|nr:MAG: hypothetical protein CSA38_01355 [Flavobacteriales bacterium]
MDRQRKNNKIILWSIYILNIVALFFIWSSPYFDYLYTRDLAIYKNAIAEFNGNYLQSLMDNRLVVILMAKILFFLSNALVVHLLQSLSILFLTYTLLKFVKPYYVLCIILISFFNLYLNQFRSALALSFCLWAFYGKHKTIFFKVVMLFLGMFSHFFVFIFFTFLFSLEKLTVLFLRYKRPILYVGFVLFLMGLGLFFYDDSIFVRYTYYFKPDGKERISLKFMIALVFLVINRKNLSRFILIGLSVILVGVFIASLLSLSSVSTRFSEWLIIFMLMYFSFNISKERRLGLGKENVFLMISGVYFLYSMLNIVLMDKKLISTLINAVSQ